MSLNTALLQIKEELNISIKEPLGISPVNDDTKILAFLTSKENGKTCIDIDTGTSCISIYLARLGFRATDMDIDPRAIKVAAGNAEMTSPRQCLGFLISHQRSLI